MRIISRLCIAGTAVGVLSLVLILSIMEDFGKKIQKKLFTFTPHFIIEQELDPLEFQSLRRDSRIKEIKPYIQQDVIIRSKDGLLGGAIAKGYKTEGFQSFLNLFKNSLDPAFQRSLFFDAAQFRKKDILMSLDLVHSMDLVEGDQIFLILPEFLLFPLGDFPQYEALNVKSVLSTETVPMYSKHIFYNSEKSFKVFRGSRSSEKGLEVFLKNSKDFKFFQDQFQRKNIPFISWKDRHAELFFALRMEKLALRVFLTLSLLITSFSILTLLIFLISQKRKDIGMLMVMGLSPQKTRKVFTQVGLWISSFGIFGGAFLGVISALLLKKYPLDLLPSRLYYDSFVSAEIHWGFLVSVVFFSLILAWMGSKVASQFYIQLNPTEALRGVRVFF